MRLPELLIVGCASMGLVGCALAPMTGPATPVVLPAATVQWHAPLHHEETLGRSQVSSHPLGGPGAARDGGAHNGTVTDLTHWWQALGDPLLAELPVQRPDIFAIVRHTV